MSTIQERLAAIDTPAKAFAALREVAYIGRIFNAEMAATVSKAADVLEVSLPLVSPGDAPGARFEEEKPPAPRVSGKDIKVSIGGVEIKPMTQVRYGCDDEPEPDE